MGYERILTTDKIEKRDYGREVTIGEIGVQRVDMEGFLQRMMCEKEAVIDGMLTQLQQEGCGR
jgi:hypothetical protein